MLGLTLRIKMIMQEHWIQNDITHKGRGDHVGTDTRNLI